LLTEDQSCFVQPTVHDVVLRDCLRW